MVDYYLDLEDVVRHLKLVKLIDHPEVERWFRSKMSDIPAFAVSIAGYTSNPDDGIVRILDVPEEWIEYVLSHEHLHLAINKILSEKEKKAKQGKEAIDFVDFHVAFVEVLGLSPLKFEKWITRRYDGRWRGLFVYYFFTRGVAKSISKYWKKGWKRNLELTFREYKVRRKQHPIEWSS